MESSPSIFVLQLLNRYWQVATITTEENARLKRTKMPDGWDKEDIRARYKLVGIELHKNPYFDENDEPRIVEIIEQIGGGRLDQSNSQPTILP